MSAEYRIILRPLLPEEGPGWLAEVPDLPGCKSDGETAEKALTNVRDAINCWMETAQKLGREIPEPQAPVDYSGKFVVRLPKTLHRALVESADREGVSLNQYVVYLLTEKNSRRVERGIYVDRVSEFAPLATPLTREEAAESSKT